LGGLVSKGVVGKIMKYREKSKRHFHERKEVDPKHNNRGEKKWNTKGNGN